MVEPSAEALEVAPMRLPLRSLSTAAIAAVTLVACGSSSTSRANAFAGRSPADVVKASAVAAQQATMRFDLAATIGFDTSKVSGLSPSEQNQFGRIGSGVSFTGKGEIESPQRVRMTLSAKPLVPNDVTVVLYDGKGYISLDGSRFSEGDVKSLTNGFQIDPTQITKFLDGAGSVTDQGQTVQDGQQVEHLQATIDTAQLQKLIAGQSGASPDASGLAQVFLQFITFKGATVDDYVDITTAKIDRLNVHFGISLDFDKLGQVFGALGGSSGASPSSIPHGQLTVNLTFGLHLYDYGATITVQKPTVDPNAPQLPSGGGGLFNLT
jgi:hypothetical protein